MGHRAGVQGSLRAPRATWPAFTGGGNATRCGLTNKREVAPCPLWFYGEVGGDTRKRNVTGRRGTVRIPPVRCPLLTAVSNVRIEPAAIDLTGTCPRPGASRTTAVRIRHSQGLAEAGAPSVGSWPPRWALYKLLERGRERIEAGSRRRLEFNGSIPWTCLRPVAERRRRPEKNDTKKSATQHREDGTHPQGLRGSSLDVVFHSWQMHRVNPAVEPLGRATSPRSE